MLDLITKLRKRMLNAVFKASTLVFFFYSIRLSARVGMVCHCCFVLKRKYGAEGNLYAEERSRILVCSCRSSRLIHYVIFALANRLAALSDLAPY